MPDEPYSISDLARLADVTPRTIRYYVSQGLLPSPDAAGPATRYGEGHLLRLRLIRRLQREHLPLAEIRGRLERMGDDEVMTLLEATPVPPPAPAPAETLAYVREQMARTGIRPRMDAPHSSLLKQIAEYRPVTPDSYPLRSEPPPGLAPAPVPSVPAPSITAPVPSLPTAPGSRSVAGDRSTWERLAITADVELHVRRPLDRLSNKKVEQLARIARELFDEEP